MLTDELEHGWAETVERPLRQINYPAPKLHILHSSYREFYGRFLRGCDFGDEYALISRLR